jgi:hypothetical protein
MAVSMTIKYDNKGKFFTDIISKEAVRSRIQTVNQLIEGDIHIRLEARLKDELDDIDSFLAVTDASVYDNAHNFLFQTGFIAIRRDQIVWVTTLLDIGEGEA